MRFQGIQIPAFGPFTNLELEFPRKDCDIHVIYGENEAGKSSLLRAIRDLLFGIHGQSPDNFLHDYKNLRLLGEIENKSGDRLTFQRRKGNRNTLLDKDDNPISDAMLAPFLGSVDQAYFSTMFGLGNMELREGARQILRGEGDVGSALFSASLGGTPIQRVLDALIEESERLFKGRATAHVSIRPAVNKYKDLLKQSRESMVTQENWETLEKESEEKAAAQKRLDNVISELEREIGWISRCEDALPSVGRLNEELRLLQELPELPELASDFVERARSARKTTIDASVKVQTLTTHITQLVARLKECQTAPQVLKEAEALDALHQDLGVYLDRKESLTNLESKLAGLKPVLRAGMKSLGIAGELETLETLRLNSALWLSCHEEAKTLEEALKKCNEATSKIEELKHKIESSENELKSLPETDLTPLREALAFAAEATNANKTLATNEAEVENLSREVGEKHGLVIGAPKRLNATASLAIPAASTIRKFRDQFEGLERDIKGEEDKIREEEKTIRNLEDALSHLGRRGELPSEDALKTARGHRDHGWQLVLEEWKGDGAKEELEQGTPLEQAFPKAIIKADEIADQLRQQADAVVQAEEKRSQIRNSQRLIARAEKNLAKLENKLKERQTSWETEWAECGIRPRSPVEMEEWRELWMEFKNVLKQLRISETAVKAKTGQVNRARKELAKVLGASPDKTFTVLFEAARRRVQKGEESTGERKQIKGQLRMHRNQLEIFEQNNVTLTKDAAKAAAHWKAKCQAVGLPEDISPSAGLSLLEERKTLLAKFDQWKELSGESNNLMESVRQFDQQVREKAEALGIQGDTTEAQQAGLWEALTQARKTQVEHDQLTRQIKEAKQELAEAKQAETQASEALEELFKLAKLQTLEELEPLLANLEKRMTIESRIEDFRKTLHGPARGQPVEEFSAQVQAENADELAPRKARLEREKEETKQALQEINGTLAGLKKQRQELEKAGDSAANLRQQAESVAAALKQDALQFLRLRLATYCLRTQIERFRKENQGPLLEKAGQVFKRMTRGAFDGLGAQFNAQDLPVLVGRRLDGSNVPVEGMSDGSRDQLYLALRLAALDRYSEEHEPMPLILDDLLITFDNERAKVILPQLADISKQTQVFLFTHHQHLVDLCRQTLGEAQFQLHQINNTWITRAN